MDVTRPGFRHHQDQVIRFLPQVWPSIHRSLPSACCNLLQGVPVRVELWIAGLRIAAWHERVCTFFFTFGLFRSHVSLALDQGHIRSAIGRPVWDAAVHHSNCTTAAAAALRERTTTGDHLR